VARAGPAGDWLEERGVVGISEIDTRALTRHIRSAGELRAVVSTEDLDERRLVERARAASGLEGKDLASLVGAGRRGRSPRENAAA
jgi:carbamoyl-phosphate synthase small subunit